MLIVERSHCGRMVVGFTNTYGISATITTKVMSLNPSHGEVYLIQLYVIKFVCGFLQILRFPPPVQLTATKHHNPIDPNC